MLSLSAFCCFWWCLAGSGRSWGWVLCSRAGRSPPYHPHGRPCSRGTVLAAPPGLAWLRNLPDTVAKVEGQGTVLGPPRGLGQIYWGAGSCQSSGSILELLLSYGSPKGWGSMCSPGPGQDLPVPMAIVPPMAHSCSNLAGDGGTPSAPLELQLCQDPLSMRGRSLPRLSQRTQPGTCWNSPGSCSMWA